MKKLYLLLAGAGMVLLCALFYSYNPQEYSFFPKCPFKVLTHLDCPGCGSQRALHALLHGDIITAADYNLLLVLFLPFLALHYAFLLFARLSGTKLVWSIWYKRSTPVLVFVLVVLFWILRNLPVYPFSYLSS